MFRCHDSDLAPFRHSVNVAILHSADVSRRFQRITPSINHRHIAMDNTRGISVTAKPKTIRKVVRDTSTELSIPIPPASKREVA